MRSDLDHVLGHVVAAHGNAAAVLLEIGDARAQAAPGGDRRIEGDGDLGPTQPLFLLRLHAAAVRGNQAIVEKAQFVQVFRRQAAALGLDGCDLAPDLVEVDGGDGIELLLQGAHVAQQFRRAHVGSPGGDADADAPLGAAVPLAVQGLDALQAALAQLAVELERRGVPDRALGLVPGPLGQQKAQAACSQILSVALDAGGVLEDGGGAATNGLEHGQLTEDGKFIRVERRQGQRRQAAGEGRLVWRRQILVDAARQGHVQVGVDVGKAWHDGLARAVDFFRLRIAGQHLLAGSDRGDAVSLNRHRSRRR